MDMAVNHFHWDGYPLFAEVPGTTQARLQGRSLYPGHVCPTRPKCARSGLKLIREQGGPGEDLDVVAGEKLYGLSRCMGSSAVVLKYSAIQVMPEINSKTICVSIFEQCMFLKNSVQLPNNVWGGVWGRAKEIAQVEANTNAMQLCS